LVLWDFFRSRIQGKYSPYTYIADIFACLLDLSLNSTVIIFKQDKLTSLILSKLKSLVKFSVKSKQDRRNY
jgi:hypothetical protein